MPDPINVYRGTFGTLPPEVSSEILQKLKKSSAIMSLATEIPVKGQGAIIPVITSDPTAAWVGETAAKPVSTPGLSQKKMQLYKLAVIVPVSEEFIRDENALYAAIRDRLPGALGYKFDQTVIGAVDAPGENFDTFASCTAQSIVAASNYTAYTGVVNAYTDIGTHGGALNGFGLSPAGTGIILGAVDGNGRPLFIPSANDEAFGKVLGQRTVEADGLYKAGAAAVGTAAGTPAIVGVAGDWRKALWGTVEGVRMKISDQATLVNGTETINLWQQNMVGIMAEIEIGFRADTSCFNKLTGAIPT